MRYTFNEVAIKATRKWIDADGKKRQQTRKFLQTLNPFNRNAKGDPKSRDEIMTELIAERDAWLSTKEPTHEQ